MENKAFIFIPDISGYTKFMNKAELDHSNIIITDLLKVIIEENHIGLHISEIEGDAILFYRPGNPPELSEIVEQAQRMFIKFHSHLKLIERDNVCQCEDCQITSELTLKFIAHYGRVDKLKIQKFERIMGKEVILAHRLLKNHLPSTEYLLLTNKLFNKCTINMVDHQGLIKMENHIEIYKNFGEVPVKYISLAPLHTTISDPPESLKMTDKTINALSSHGCIT